MGKWGGDHVYKKAGAWHLQFYTSEIRDGVLVKVRRSKRLCEAKGVTQKHVNSLAAAEMVKIESHVITAEDMRVVDFWERVYLPYWEWKGTGMRASTLSGYKQLWKHHLKDHFATLTLQG